MIFIVRVVSLSQFACSECLNSLLQKFLSCESDLCFSRRYFYKHVKDHVASVAGARKDRKGEGGSCEELHLMKQVQFNALKIIKTAKTSYFIQITTQFVGYAVTTTNLEYTSPRSERAPNPLFALPLYSHARPVSLIPRPFPAPATQASTPKSF